MLLSRVKVTKLDFSVYLLYLGDLIERDNPSFKKFNTLSRQRVYIYSKGSIRKRGREKTGNWSTSFEFQRNTCDLKTHGSLEYFV